MRLGPAVCNSTSSTNEFTEILHVTLSAPIKTIHLLAKKVVHEA